MINIENIKNIIFDFDGVILDSVELKTQAFAELFKEFPKNKVQELVKYHIQNGGISRYHKIQ
ncbi:HAD hydrolase-like protein, partial [Campylobacter coli]|nr:HAD family hydrolase [Campylobacter coli]EAL4571190.1 HAD family hydrolase [Campylobacter coli]EHC1546097.1 HAD hydrolase-like protein [Campylobacter coli]